MHKWIAGSTCAAALLSFAVASAQTYPQQPSDNQPTTRSTPSTKSGSGDTSQTTGTERRATPASRSANTAQRVTMTGCFMQGTAARSWMLSNATMASGTNTSASRSGSPSNEGRTATRGANRDGTTGVGVSGSTSTEVGTSGVGAGASVDTEAHGAGTVGATDQSGSTVGAGATAGATGNTSANQSATGNQNSTSNPDYSRNSSTSKPNPSQSTSTSSSASANVAGGGSSYELAGVKNPNQYNNKRVEVIGTIRPAGKSGEQMLRVTSVRIVGQSCQ